MPAGFVCDWCGRFHNEAVVQTKITIELEPREYAAPVVLDSVACLTAYLPRLEDDEAWAQERRIEGWMETKAFNRDLRAEDAAWVPSGLSELE